MNDSWVIHKAALIGTITELRVPADTKFLHAAFQRRVPTIWYQRPFHDANIRARNILLVQTGDPRPEGAATFIGTMLSDEQDFVLHAFELLQ